MPPTTGVPVATGSVVIWVGFAAMLAVVASSLTLTAQTTPPQAARTYTTPRQAELTQQFQEFLSIPNVAAAPAALRRNADFLSSFFVVFLPILLAYYPMLMYALSQAKSGNFPWLLWIGNVVLLVSGYQFMKRVIRY